jgi:putative Mg2+ transporter-C (MgtC) family protein
MLGAVALELELALQAGLAALLGGVLGLERELRGHDPGIRTHALVGLGAALFTIAGAHGFAALRPDSADPMRLAAQVATGIGFVGAGAILQDRGSIRGLTTAATLWVAAAVGVAAGAGLAVASILAVVTALVVLVVVQALKVPVASALGQRRRLVRIDYERGHGTLGPLLEELAADNADVGDLRLHDDGDARSPGIRRVTLAIDQIDDGRLCELVERIDARDEVVAVSVETPTGEEWRIRRARGHDGIRIR